jgi:hypothetical protein
MSEREKRVLQQWFSALLEQGSSFEDVISRLQIALEFIQHGGLRNEYSKD